MGLCKCPKKVVTTLFCYEHRVNVCQRCLATNHPQCVVQSYLEWLKDSDYDPTCKLCSEPLANKECIRLLCLHLFHWDCMDQYCGSLPSTTAPAGYKCEHCESSVFPPANVSSLIADYCREKLASVNWGRRGLGLPLLSQDDLSIGAQDIRSGFTEPSSNANSSPTMPRPWLEPHEEQSPRKDSTVVHFVEDQIHARGLDGQVPRRTHSSLDDVAPLDADDDKYARRAAKPLSWFKWFQRRVASRRCTLTRVLLLLLSFTVIFVLFLTIDMTHIPE